MPNVEEFGIVAVAAQAAGRPVIGMASSTAERVVDGRTGIPLDRRDVNVIASAMLDSDLDRMDPADVVEHASRLSATRFRAELAAQVERRVSGAPFAGFGASEPVPESSALRA